MRHHIAPLIATALFAGLPLTAAQATGPVTVYETPAEIVSPPMARAYDWSGGSIGLRVGASFGENFWGERGLGLASTPGDWDGTPFGLSAGYDLQSGGLVYGAAIDYTGGELIAGSTGNAGFGCAGGTCETRVDNQLAIRGRVGVAMDRTLFYATAGLASGEARGQAVVTNGSDRLIGWTAGLGVEHALSDNFSVNLEYLYTDLGRLELPNACATDCYTDVDYGTLRVGAQFRF
ncbi:hypothetical protein C4N9_19950 [Pararhodobacter marinus]|uniref:Outer membrane protein beta-barrel domain-containing protein n=1 Tax=Pararhodobacter marinus TaxID=2184063 RepID=A0A2U2C4Y3_9RHOB|nr:outer membrane beta-barrel protein [Pararhodobacter marinus]PWE26864.1 hypothetical protein C4N9_19950 [Pararhodobacter marinus]